MRLLGSAWMACCLALIPMLAAAQPAGDRSRGLAADKPLFRDPVFDGAADPALIYNFRERRWWMFYTNRRAKLPESEIDGVNWVHGTKIGIAESRDGAHWQYVGTANIDVDVEDATYWAPAVTFAEGRYHMFLTVVPGVFRDWGHPRSIVHLVSDNLRDWQKESTLELASQKVIDASVLRLRDGTWRLWYNNEADGKSIYFADSDDLEQWQDRGKVRLPELRGGEGPCVFAWQGAYWMVLDEWKGLAVYRSDDALNWQRQSSRLLAEPGAGDDDGVIGQHADVLVLGDRAYLFYFTHPGRAPGAEGDGYQRRRSSIQVAELKLRDGQLVCDRDAPTQLNLRFRRQTQVHDPSTILYRDGRYWCFSTGNGVQAMSSPDLENWTLLPPVLDEPPGWVQGVAPGNRGHFWAPDVIELDGRFLVYYSASVFGKRTSAIALATSPSLDPQADDYGWTEQGVVIQTDGSNDYNAIDPSVIATPDGKLWMAFGSYWSGIKLIELDPTTGKRIAPDSPVHSIASKREIEAATLHHRDGYYYLLVNWGVCCRGVDSTYEIRVGRSRDVTGPYVDRDGVDLREGGGTLVLGTRGTAIGPGHAGVFEREGQSMLSYHFYDGEQRGRPRMGISRLNWDDEGWPRVEGEMAISGTPNVGE